MEIVIYRILYLSFTISRFFIHCYLETLQHLGHIASRGLWVCTRRLCISIVVWFMFHLLSSLILFYDIWIYVQYNGQMDRGNENPTQHLPWCLRKSTKRPQSRLPAQGFEPCTSRMRVSCVTTEPPRSIDFLIIIGNEFEEAELKDFSNLVTAHWLNFVLTVFIYL